MDIKDITNQIKELEKYKDKYERIKEIFDSINSKINEAVVILQGITGTKISKTGVTRGNYKIGLIPEVVETIYLKIVESGGAISGNELDEIGISKGLVMKGSTAYKVRNFLLEKPFVKKRKDGHKSFFYISKENLKNAKNILDKKEVPEEKGEGYVEVSDDGTKAS